MKRGFSKTTERRSALYAAAKNIIIRGVLGASSAVKQRTVSITDPAYCTGKKSCPVLHPWRELHALQGYQKRHHCVESACPMPQGMLQVLQPFLGFRAAFLVLVVVLLVSGRSTVLPTSGSSRRYRENCNDVIHLPSPHLAWHSGHATRGRRPLTKQTQYGTGSEVLLRLRSLGGVHLSTVRCSA